MERHEYNERLDYSLQASDPVSFPQERRQQMDQYRQRMVPQTAPGAAPNRLHQENLGPPQESRRPGDASEYTPLLTQLRLDYPFLADDLHRIQAEFARLHVRLSALSTFRHYIEYMAVTRSGGYRPQDDLSLIEAKVERVNDHLNELSALRDDIVFMRTHWERHVRQQHLIMPSEQSVELGVPGETVPNLGIRGEMETSSRRRVIQGYDHSGAASRHGGRGEGDEGGRVWPESRRSRRESNGFPVARSHRMMRPAVGGTPGPPSPSFAIPRGPRLPPARSIPRT